MVFKEMVAMLLDGKGGYTCSDDIASEKALYNGMYLRTQYAVDHARQLDPSETPDDLSKYITENSIGQTMLKAKECLEQHGYDMSTLPQVVVPEFGDIASLILKIGIGGAILAGTYAAKYFMGNKGNNLFPDYSR